MAERLRNFLIIDQSNYLPLCALSNCHPAAASPQLFSFCAPDSMKTEH